MSIAAVIRKELSALKTGARELRQFGLLVGGVLLLISGWLFWRDKPALPYVAIPGTALVLLGLIAPLVLRRIYLVWMSLAFVLGFVISSVLLTLLFYLLLTPIGLLARLVGKDFLRLHPDPSASSCWIVRDRSKAYPREKYERQY